jgi:ribosomal protein S24E
MKIEIISQKKNPLMGREDVQARINHDGQRTPSRQEILKEIAHALKTNENHIIIDRIFTVQGQAVSNAKIMAYERKEDVPAYKMDKMKRRMKLGKEAPAEKPAEEKKAE